MVTIVFRSINATRDVGHSVLVDLVCWSSLVECKCNPLKDEINNISSSFFFLSSLSNEKKWKRTIEMVAYYQVLDVINKFLCSFSCLILYSAVFSCTLTCNAYFRSRFIPNYMCGNINGLHRNVI